MGFLTRVSVHFHANAKLHCHVSEPDKKKNYSPKTSFFNDVVCATRLCNTTELKGLVRGE